MKVYRYYADTLTFKGSDNTVIDVLDLKTGQAGYMTKGDIKKEIRNRHMNFINAEIDENNSLNFRDKSKGMVADFAKGFELVEKKAKEKIPNLRVIKKGYCISELLADSISDYGYIMALYTFQLETPDGNILIEEMRITYDGYGYVVYEASNPNFKNYEMYGISRLDDLLKLSYNNILANWGLIDNRINSSMNIAYAKRKKDSNYAQKKYNISEDI